MATSREVLALIVNADAKQAISELEKVGKTADKEMGKAKTATDKWAANLTKSGAAAVGFAGIAGTALFKFAQKSEEARRQQIKLDQTLATVPALAGANRKAFDDLAKSIHNKTVVDDDQVTSAEAVLGQFGLTQDAVLKLTPLVVDLSRKMGIDLDQAAKIVGKAMGGNAGALKRVGIELDANTFKTDRLAAVQAGLSQAVGGFAEREGKTFSGRLAILKNQLGDIEEGIGSGVVDAVSKALGPVTKLSHAFASLPPDVQKTVGVVGTFGTVTIGALGLGAIAAAKLVSSVKVLREAFDAYAAKKAATTGIEVANTAAVEANTVALGENAVAAAEAGTAAKAGAVGVGALGAAAVGTASSFGVLGIAFGNAKLDDRAQGFSNVGKAAYVAARGFSTAIPGAQVLTSALGFLGGGHKKAADAAEEDAAATADNTERQKELADQLAATEQKIHDYTDAVYGVRDAQRAQDDATLGLQDALQGYLDKTGAAAKATNDGGAAARDAKRAYDDVTGAIDAVAQAAANNADQQAKVRGKTLDAADSAKVQRDALIELRDQIAPNSPFRLYLEGLIKDLDKAAQARTGSLTINTSVTGPLTPNAVSTSIRLGKEGLSVPGRAAGGPVKRDQPYLVGEKGPELFVPRQSGTIVPNNKVTAHQTHHQRQRAVAAAKANAQAATDGKQSYLSDAASLASGVDGNALAFTLLVAQEVRQFGSLLRALPKLKKLGLKHLDQVLAAAGPDAANLATNFLAHRDLARKSEIFLGSLEADYINYTKKYPQRASGGPVSRGTKYLVGERGPELFIPRSNSSHWRGGGDVVVNLNASIHADSTTTGRRVMAELIAELKSGNGKNELKRALGVAS